MPGTLDCRSGKIEKMKIGYLDCFSGISGDMTVGALLSAGASLDVLRHELQKIDLSGYEIDAKQVVRNGITAIKADVIVSGKQSAHRHLTEIRRMIGESGLSSTVKENALRIFTVIGEAEAHVHNLPIDKVHFHEVGAVDSIIDIVGTSICLDLLGISRVYSSPVRLGNGGQVKTDHGILPTPTPATVEILRDYPTVLTDIPEELTTPTGAGIIRGLSHGTLVMERLRLSSIGYGAGTKEFPRLPNLLRAMVGELEEPFDEDELVSIETNIDDMNPEIYPYVIDSLLTAGAHDAYLVPVIMKKGRPGVLLSVLAARSVMEPLLRIVFSETSTLGVRIQPLERRKVKREVRTVKTSWGDVRAKVVLVNGAERITPEYEECKRIAIEKQIPLIEVYRMLEKEFRG